MMQLKAQFLKRLLAHTRLNEDEQELVLALPGSVAMVQMDGDAAQRGSCTLVVEGLVARTGHTEDGRQQICGFFVPGSVPDITGLMMAESVASLQAVCDAKIFRIPKAEIWNAMLRNPAIGEALWREVALDAAMAQEWMLNVGQRPARQRLAHLICETAVRAGEAREGGFEFAFPVTQTRLAEATGLSTVHVNRVLQALRKQGLVHLSNYKAQVYDWQRLREMAGFDPAYLMPPAPQ